VSKPILGHPASVSGTAPVLVVRARPTSVSERVLPACLPGRDDETAASLEGTDVDRFGGFADFVAARGASLSRTAFLLAGDDEVATDLMRRALANVAGRWQQGPALGNPEAYARAALARAYLSGTGRRWADPESGLSPRQWTIAVLQYDGYSAAEIGAALEWSESTVRANIQPVARVLLQRRAAAAGNYADPALAIAAAVRGRLRRRLLPLVVILVVAGGVAVVVTRHGADRAGPAPLPKPSTASVVRLPEQVTEPPPGTPTLPTDRAVGRALIAYRSCARSCPAYLMLADRTQYRLTVPNLTGCCARWSAVQRDLPVSLSPTGRWLAISDGHQVTLRDLLSTDSRTVPLTDIVAWSPTDQFMLGDCDAGLCRFGLNWQQGLAVANLAPVAIDDSGRLLTTSLGYLNTAVQVDISNPTTSVVITGGDLIRASEGFSSDDRSAPLVMAFGPDGWYAIVAYTLTSGRPSALVLGNYRDNTVASRGDLPDGSGAPFFFGLEPTFPVQTRPADPVVLYGLAPGGLVARSSLPARAEFVVAGANLPSVGPAVAAAARN